jgi:hypothetical protein
MASENPEFAEFIQKSLNRNVRGDWGEIDKEDKQASNEALKRGTRLLSAYNDDQFPKNGLATIWIITESDRGVTTVLSPDEY